MTREEADSFLANFYGDASTAQTIREWDEVWEKYVRILMGEEGHGRDSGDD